MGDNNAVRVVVRIRPQIPRDIIDLCHVCTSVNPTEPQVWLGKDKAFTFDQVFDMHTEQSEIYQNCVTELVKGCFEGYNATVLAYGQTGSGKTYTMGTGFDLNLCHEERGIIPRAVEQLFEEISARQKSAKENGLPSPEFKINAQFMELYNEEIIDLLDPARETEDKNKKYHIKIHEDASGGIYTVGVIAQCVTSVEEALNCLKLGSLSRTTASTGMNAQSSRSHAIFTLHIKQQRLVKLMDGVEDSCNSNFHEHTDVLNEFETLTAKFHFVDLAGSERLKRTRATGDRQKEGISINCGLLALGNVISALGDKSRKITHVPYRDSKLTRLLQDSLGGNSRTLMIACISPSDRDFMETLNTLKYANRAKNIKNKVTVNLDKTSQTINMLRQEVENLRLELMEYKQGKRIVADDGSERVNDMYHENTMLQSENNTLKTRIKALQETVDRLTVKNSDLLAEKAAGNWISGGSVSEISPVIQGYIKEIETLRAKLMESEEVCSYLRKHFQKPSARLSTSPTSTVAVTGHYDIRMDSSPSVYELLEEAKEDVKKLKRKKKKLKDANVEKETEDDKESVEENEANLDEKTEGIESSSESEITEENDYSENLADLTCEISIKQKLIEQLEMSQRRLQNMRQHYEEKLVQLLNKIQETEKERNRVLSNLSKGTSDNQSEDKVKRVREEFEKKLIALQNDVKQMQAAKKEHAQMMKNQAEYERQLKKLKHELSDLKRTKVSLINKMKEETLKHKETEQRRSKEIAKLKKESRHKENQIKALEAEKKIKENILRRKQEEVTLLRRRNKPASDKLAGRLKNSPSNLRYNIFSPKMAKQKWQTLEKKINKLVLNKQSISTIEKDMERWLHEREKLSRYLEKAVKKRDRAMIEMKDYEIINEIEEEIENLKANIEYIHENIADCQTSIVQVEETKEDMDAIDINTLMQNTHIEESKYLLEKLLNMAISQSFQAAQRENTIKELEAQLKQVIENNAVQQQLLRHVIHQANEDLLNIFMSSQEPDAASVHSSRSESPVDNSTQDLGIHAPATKPQGKKKARNAPATPEQMLFVNNAPPNVDVEHNPIYECGDSGVNVASDMHEGMLCDPMGIPEGNLMRRTISSSTFTHSPSVVIQSKSSRAVTSSGSPPIYEMGEILPFSGRQGSEKNPLLICTHVAEGHDKAVLCIECTEDVLFSSSKDCTVKIWDLNTGQEIQKFSGHPEEVVKVRYCEYTRLAFTASGPFIKIWDVRENPSSCVRTLSSSGTTKPGHAPLSSFPKEHSSSAANRVNDIALNHYGTTLFSAAANTIRMWDLKMFESIGTLNGSQQSAVACLAVDDMGMDINLVISGSKDCSIKLFEVMEGTRGVHPPKWTLVPPHLDEIQSLVINGDFLFSGSKDRCIKKWDLQKHCCVKFLPEAHKDWVTSLNMIPSENLLLSACKSGYLKLWSASTCDFLEAVKAHGAPINCVTSNSSSIFTASDDSSVGMWKFGSASYGPDFDFLDDRIKY